MEVVFEAEQRVLGENTQLLGDASLSQLRKYKYSSVDRSLLSYYVLNPFWNWCASKMPLWLAPNCITLIGISAIVFSNLLVMVFQHGGDLVSPMPRFVYLFTAFAFFFYQTMDNVDGKQARRTNSSSPLGELFDHGIDSLNCLWGSLLMVASLSEGSTWTGVANLLAPMLGMYFSTWETYYTKTLFLDYLNAPTEGLIVAVCFHLASGLGGPQFLTENHIWGTDLPLGMLWTIMLVISVLLLHIPSCVKNVYLTVRATPSSTTSTSGSTVVSGNILWMHSLRNLLPAAVLGGSVLLWCSGPESVILDASGDGSQGHLFMFGWALAFTFGRVSTTIILSHLCHQPFPRLSFPLLMLLGGAVFYGLLPRFGLHWALVSELSYLRFYLIASGVYFFGFSKLVIDRLTSYLGISAFTVPPRF